MPLHLQNFAESGPLPSHEKARGFSAGIASLIAVCLVAMSGCIALSIPSKRFHDPQDHGGLFGDFRRSGSANAMNPHAEGEWSDSDPEQLTQCTDEHCSSMHCQGQQYDDEAEYGDEGHHPKPPNIPWPRYHPVPTRPVFSGFPGMQP
jgi:hypothetical protein